MSGYGLSAGEQCANLYDAYNEINEIILTLIKNFPE